jgi:hypothetical protein
MMTTWLIMLASGAPTRIERAKGRNAPAPTASALAHALVSTPHDAHATLPVRPLVITSDTV